MIEERFEDRVKTVFRMRQEALPRALAELDRDLLTVVLSYLETNRFAYRREVRDSSELLCVDASPQLPGDLQAGITVATGSSLEHRSLHLGHPLAQIAIEDARQVSRAPDARVTLPPDAPDALRLTASTNFGDYLLETSTCDQYTNAQLTITLKLGFRQINPAGGAGTGTYNDYGDPSKKARRIVPWTSSSWMAWIKSLVRGSASFWNGRLCLVNNFSDLDVQVGNVTYRPNIDCRLALHGEQAARSGYHYVIDVVKLDPSEQSFGSTSRLYDSRDLRPVAKGVDRNGRPIMQLGGVHEIGHLLGLEHVDYGKPHCPVTGDANASVATASTTRTRTHSWERG